MRKVYRFIRLPAEDRAALMLAFRTLMTLRLGMWLFPVRVMRKRVHIAAGNRGNLPREPDLRTSGSSSVQRIVWAVKTAAPYIPCATCLTQALAGQWLLRYRGYRSELYLGVAKSPSGDFRAHAWLQCGDCVVIGGGDLRGYTPLLAWEEIP
jgi:hypothetical protein